MIHPQADWTVPAATAEVARAAFAKGNMYMKMGDYLGQFYRDQEFENLFRHDCGQSAYSPAKLALVSVMQFSEGLSDRQTADGVRGRIDWKYALGLELSDAGFNYSILSEFRSRLIAGGREAQLLNTLLTEFQSKGWLKTRGKMRTDSTHVLAATRQVNELECVGETMRQALEALAVIAPEWLRAQVNDDWFERYERRIEMYRLPKAQTEREAVALTIGRDGHQLLAAMAATDAPAFLAQVPAVETLRQVWLQQYRLEAQQVVRRQRDEQPPNHQLIQSPYDLEARNRTKRQTNWTGYAVHLSETCDPGYPHLITHVHTTPATTADNQCLPIIHQALQDKALLPAEHLVDTTYMTAAHLVDAHAAGIDLVAPVPPDTSWQAREPEGLALSCFTLDWDAQHVQCPAGCLSHSWKPRTESDGNEIIEVSFATQDCQSCSLRLHCTHSKSRPRLLKFRRQAEHQALTHARLYQSTDAFKQRYRQRAGIEGTLSLATHGFKMRRTRYIGLAKTHLQHILTATAINLSRCLHWLADTPMAKTRTSRFAALASSL